MDCLTEVILKELLGPVVHGDDECLDCTLDAMLTLKMGTTLHVDEKGQSSNA